MFRRTFLNGDFSISTLNQGYRFFFKPSDMAENTSTLYFAGSQLCICFYFNREKKREWEQVIISANA